MNISGPDFGRDVALKEPLIFRNLLLLLGLVLLLLMLVADIDPLSADANLVGLLLDQVDDGDGVGQLLKTAVDILQGSDDLLLLDALLDFALVLVAVLLRDSAALLAFAFLGSFLVKHVGVSNELALPHDALLRGPEVSSLLAIHVSTEATAAAVNELRSDDFDAEAVGDDLKENKIVKWALKN